jgi:energy-coupling factor transport system permease protein
MIAERLLENLLLRAEQMASAMTVRGFTTPNQHHVKWYQLQIRWIDRFALAALTVFWTLRLILGAQA